MSRSFYAVVAAATNSTQVFLKRLSRKKLRAGIAARSKVIRRLRNQRPRGHHGGTSTPACLRCPECPLAPRCDGASRWLAFTYAWIDPLDLAAALVASLARVVARLSI